MMTDRANTRLVYSTGAGRMCPHCRRPVRDCHCNLRDTTETTPSRIVAKLRVEKKGRGGKTVSVVDGLPRNAVFVKELCQELKRACGTGGGVVDGGIELQGDLRPKIREWLSRKGFVVKG